MTWYVVSMPGRSYDGALDFTAQEIELAARLRAHVEALAAEQRNVDLERPARYIEEKLVSAKAQIFESGGRRVRNIETGAGPIVVGAHYDTVPGSPGADDNASGVAVLIELARLNADAGGIQFVAFANEEMPYFMSREMGSYFAATQARGKGEKLRA